MSILMITRLSIIVSLFSISCTLSSKKKNVDEVINTELKFAKTAVDKSTKTAFLDFVDSSGVMFENGKAVNGIEFWNARPTSTTKLLWHPTYAGIAESGDLAFTTGPWIFKRSMDNDTILASGFFSTIWHLNKNGEWKFLVDLGIDCSSEPFQNKEITKWKGGDSSKSNSDDILSIENKFISEYESNGTVAFKNFIDEDSWFHVNGNLPFKGENKIITEGLSKIPAGLKFVPLNSGMASTRDLGYVYGTVELNGKQENYLRVWTPAKTRNIILLQVLR